MGYDNAGRMFCGRCNQSRNVVPRRVFSNMQLQNGWKKLNLVNSLLLLFTVQVQSARSGYG